MSLLLAVCGWILLGVIIGVSVVGSNEGDHRCREKSARPNSSRTLISTIKLRFQPSAAVSAENDVRELSGIGPTFSGRSKRKLALAIRFSHDQ